MTFAKLLRLSSPAPASTLQEQAWDPPSSAAWPYDNPMLLGIPQGEFTPGVRRALWALLGEARSLRSDLERTRASLKAAEEAIDRDHLLPVLNRRAFARELTRQIASAIRYATPATLIYLDLDGLKISNDAYGHACGDAVLTHFCTILLSTLRSSDLVGRLGGDEFGVVILHADEKQAESTCTRIQNALRENAFDWRGNPIAVRFTFGTVRLAADMDSERAIAAADAAMYRNKSVRR
jgi:diguanylate cyclase (GGDEF)-like protein